MNKENRVLINYVIKQVKLDCSNGYFESLETFLSNIYSDDNYKHFKAYLSENVEFKDFTPKYIGEDFEPGY